MRVPISETSDPIKKHWARSLKAIDDTYSNGFSFVGVYLEPGTEVDIDDLRPNREFPEEPIVLEHMTLAGAGGRTRMWARLWKYDLSTGAWNEIAKGRGAQWAKDLIVEGLKHLPRGKNEKAPDEAKRKGAKTPWDIWSNLKSAVDH